MLTKKINVSILLISQAARVAIILSFAIFLAHFSWWILSPVVPAAYVEKAHVNPKDNNVKFIINRYPFGVVTKPKVEAAPAIASKVHVNGIYFNTATSFAFIDYDSKAMVLKTGDSIVPGVVVSAINLQSIEITENGTSTKITLTGVSSTTPAKPPLPSRSNNVNLNSRMNTSPPPRIRQMLRSGTENLPLPRELPKVTPDGEKGNVATPGTHDGVDNIKQDGNNAANMTPQANENMQKFAQEKAKLLEQLANPVTAVGGKDK